MKVYVASSWREPRQQEVVKVLREAGHDVYDFRNPPDGKAGFSWSEIDPNWLQWTPEEFRKALRSDIAQGGFNRDMKALVNCDACVHVVPHTAGRSSHLELGYATGAGKLTIVLLGSGEPELMYRMANILCTSVTEVVNALALSDPYITKGPL